MVALSRASLAGLPERVQRPGYDRDRVRAGIAHFSVGNFHRAHQAVYVDRCLASPGQEGWGICGVGLIDNAAERAKAKGMAEQDGLYTLSLFPPRGEPTREGGTLGGDEAVPHEAIASRAKPMARPARKRHSRSGSTSLRQPIRSRGRAPAEMEVRASRPS